MARHGENIYHRKDGRWEGRYIVGRKPNGKPKFKSIYGKSYTETKEMLTVEKARHIQAGEKPPITIYGNGTFSDWMDFWLNICEKPYIKETTYQLYKRNIDKHLRPLLGSIIVSQLQKEDIQASVNLWKVSLASSTLHGICRQLKSILNHAVKSHLIDQNPYQDIRIPKTRKHVPRVLTTEEQIRLEQTALQNGNLEYLVFLYTGVRVGELCALRYGDIEFVRSTLSITHSVKRIQNPNKSEGRRTLLVVADPKTESAVRDIPLPYFLTQLLSNRMLQSHASANDYIFSNTKSGPSDPRAIQARFARLAEKLEIKGAHLHTLRHTFAMRCLENGMGYKALSEILGHSSSRITIQCYDNCTWESKERIMNSSHLLIA